MMKLYHMKDEMSTSKRERYMNWNIIVYPESSPADWRDIINETHIEWVCSPLHDRDIDPTGETKKPHWHVTLLYPSLKAHWQVEELTSLINTPIPVKCLSVSGSIRYMVHKDNPDKAQYEWSDIVCYGGADLSSLCAPTSSERLQIQADIIAYIQTAGITEYKDIVDYAMVTNREWLNVLLNYSTISINAYIRSCRHQAEREARGMVIAKEDDEDDVIVIDGVTCQLVDNDDVIVDNATGQIIETGGGFSGEQTEEISMDDT